MTIVKTELKDVIFSGDLSLSSLGLHVEKQGLTSLFAIPSYSYVNEVDWQEYDGLDVDFTTASLNPLQMQIKIFGEDSAVVSLVSSLRQKSETGVVTVAVRIQEDTFDNKITFSTKFNGATKTKKSGSLTFATLTFTRHDNSEYFGLLYDNTRTCQGIPNVPYWSDVEYPTSATPILLRRYSVTNRIASLVSEFEFEDNKVMCYPLKGIAVSITQFEQSKTAFEIQTENMVGEVMQTKNATRRKGKTINVPLLIRSHSVSAIFYFLGQLKQFIYTTLKGGDMLYLCGDMGNYAVYPTGCNVTKAYLNDQPWVEMAIAFNAYKEGFNYSASTDNVPDDNPDPPLPPTPEPTFDPYEGIDKTQWSVCTFSVSNRNDVMIPLLASPDYNEEEGKFLQYPYNQYRIGANTAAWLGWSVYARYIAKFPVGTLFFASHNSRTQGGKTRWFYNTLIVMPWAVGHLAQALQGYATEATTDGWNKSKLTLVGVIQVCEVISDNFDNWASSLQDAPKYGGLVGSGTVRVHSDVLAMVSSFDVASGLTLTSSEDFDTLVDNVVGEFESNPQLSGYYTETGYNNTYK